MKVLMVLTSHDQLGDTGRKTGFWLEEILGIPSFLRDSILPQRLGEKALLTKRFAAGDNEGGCATA